MGMTQPADLNMEQSTFAQENTENVSVQEWCYKDNPESQGGESHTPVSYYSNRSLAAHLTADLTTQAWRATVVTSPSGF